MRRTAARTRLAFGSRVTAGRHDAGSRPHIVSFLALTLLPWAGTACQPAGPEGEASGTGEPSEGTAARAETEAAGARAAHVAGPEPFKLTVPQNDLDVTVDGFRIIPPMGMGSWAAFAPSGEGHRMLVMGDVVVREDEIGPVERELVARGLTVTGLHNHFVREAPSVMYMHIRGEGPRDSLRASVEAVFRTVARLRGGDPASAPADEVENTLDTDRIAGILGHAGEASRGIYKVTIGRSDVRLVSGRVDVTTAMGFNTWAAWQGTPERAAVAGDFVMLEDEVAPVIEALVEGGLEVVAVHNHMVHEEPRVFFLHYWGTGPADDLARILRTALERTGAAPPSE